METLTGLKCTSGPLARLSPQPFVFIPLGQIKPGSASSQPCGNSTSKASGFCINSLLPSSFGSCRKCRRPDLGRGMAQQLPVNMLYACCMCSPEQGSLVPKAAGSAVWWPLKKAKHVFYIRVGVLEGRCKAKGTAADTSETTAHSFSLRAGRVDGGREKLHAARASVAGVQPPASCAPTLKVLREFFISATFSSMAQRQLLTFSSRAYSPCWIRDSSCIASVKPAFNSEANACN